MQMTNQVHGEQIPWSMKDFIITEKPFFILKTIKVPQNIPNLYCMTSNLSLSPQYVELFLQIYDIPRVEGAQEDEI